MTSTPVRSRSVLDLPVTAPRRLVRRAFALLAMATVALVVLPLIAITPADAHGAPTRPGSRTYLCRIDGTSNSGDIEPNNPACAEAVEIGGKQPLWDWFGVLRGDGAGRTRGYIPDGQLCSGGEPKYRGYDLARTDWPYTSLSAGSEMTFRYNAWAAHPGQFRMYITKDGYDPTVPLTWDDLEPEPFSVYDQGQPNGTDEQNGTPDYQWTATLPQKSGPHIIYSIWERSDSAETFYGCSDVRFDGGTGQVIGIGAGANPVGDPGPATPVTTVPAPTPTTAMPSAMSSADGAIPSGQAATGEGATGQAMVDGASGDADGADPAQTGTGDATSDAIPANDPGSSPDASVAGQSATSGVEVAAQSATDGNNGSGAVPGGVEGVEGVGTAAPATAVPAGSGSEATDPSSSSDGGLNGLIVLLVGITGVAVGVAATAAFFAARVTRSLPTTRPANEWAMASWPGPSSAASSTGASATTGGTDDHSDRLVPIRPAMAEPEIISTSRN